VRTSYGAPAVAVVPVETLEVLRGAWLRLLVHAMDTRWARVQAQVAREPQGEATSEEALEALVEATVRRARGHPRRR